MIVLLTDFGYSEYVGVMKGVIYNISGEAKIVDLCHNISPQNVIEASWILKSNYKYFPKDSVFCCVVDPGVGTERKAIAVKTDKYYFVGPDNGLLWETLQEQKIIEIRIIKITESSSRTFHGRDVFAKAAAEIELGRFESVGIETKKIMQMELFLSGNEGVIVRIDTFGNIITNITGMHKRVYDVELGRKHYKMNFYPNYALAQDNELFLIEGSNNTLEISLKNAGANDILQLKTGQSVIIS
jgi:S-adenosylmethionine hydrolase